MTGPYAAPVHTSPFNDGSATDAAALVTAIGAGLYALETALNATGVSYDPTTSAGYAEENGLIPEGAPILSAIAATDVQSALDDVNRKTWASDLSFYKLATRDTPRLIYPLVGANPTTATGEWIPGIAPNGGRQDNSGASLTLQPPNQYPLQEVVLTASTTLTLPAATIGARLEVVAVQDGTGSRTLAWGAGSGQTLKWPGGSAPAQTSTANSSDVYRFLCTVATVWRGYRTATDVR